MKKLFSLLALLGVVALSGCSCSKEGTYVFDSIVTVEGEEEKAYYCTQEDIEEKPESEWVCSIFSGMKVSLKDHKVVMEMYDKDGNVIEEARQEVDYKIEDGKFMVKEKDEENYEETGSYEDGKLVINFDEGVKVIFKKK